MTKSVAEATGAKVYYHTGEFTWQKNGAMIGAGVLALTALVIATLVLLHQHQFLDVGKLGSISPEGISALYAGGGTAGLAYFIGLAVSIVKHLQAKKSMEAFLDDTKGHDFWKVFDTLHDSFTGIVSNSGPYMGQTMILNEKNAQKEIHLFSTKELFASSWTHLNQVNLLKLTQPVSV